MQNITEVTVFFASLMAVAAVAGAVLFGLLAGRIVAQQRAARPVVVRSSSASGRRTQPLSARLAGHPRRTAHQH